MVLIGRRIFFICLVFLSCQVSKPEKVDEVNFDKNATYSIPYYPLKNEQSLDVLIDKIGGRSIVLMGEASHGTSEFHEWRAKLSKRLIQEKQFKIIAVEGDWSEFMTINDFIHGKLGSKNAINVLRGFKRWPTWLWNTEEFAEFITWIKEINESREKDEKISIYGLDLYSIGGSLDALRQTIDDTLSREALDDFATCFQPFWNNALSYSVAIQKGRSNCSTLAKALKEAFISHQNRIATTDKKFMLQQHIQTVYNGEQYFRTIVLNQAQSWNLRDRHMQETIDRLLSVHSRNSKIIVWAHNSHVGDAAFTDMPQRGRTNLGELLRRKYSMKKVFIVGFGMYTGEVIAAMKWDSSSKIFQLPPAYKGSWEELLHSAGDGNKILLSEEMRSMSSLNRWYDQRGIGVIYHPERPRSPYVPSFISRRYDAFIFIDSSHVMKVIR